MTDKDTLHDIHILFFDLLLALHYSRHNIVTVLDLLPHIQKFNYLNSKVVRQQYLIRIRVELKKRKKALKER